MNDKRSMLRILRLGVGLALAAQMLMGCPAAAAPAAPGVSPVAPDVSPAAPAGPEESDVTSVAPSAPVELVLPLTPAAVQGQPAALVPGKVFGYFIWQEGDRWFMKATTTGAAHKFTGTIRAVSTFFSVSKFNLGSNDSVRLNDKLNKISFTFRTGGPATGFLIPGRDETLPHEWPDTASGLSFVVTDGTTVKFSLKADGQPVGSADIYIGRANLHPTGGMFEKPPPEPVTSDKK